MTKKTFELKRKSVKDLREKDEDKAITITHIIMNNKTNGKPEAGFAPQFGECSSEK